MGRFNALMASSDTSAAFADMQEVEIEDIQENERTKRNEQHKQHKSQASIAKDALFARRFREYDSNNWKGFMLAFKAWPVEAWNNIPRRPGRSSVYDLMQHAKKNSITTYVHERHVFSGSLARQAYTTYPAGEKRNDFALLDCLTIQAWIDLYIIVQKTHIVFKPMDHFEIDDEKFDVKTNDFEMVATTGSEREGNKHQVSDVFDFCHTVQKIMYKTNELDTDMFLYFKAIRQFIVEDIERMRDTDRGFVRTQPMLMLAETSESGYNSQKFSTTMDILTGNTLKRDTPSISKDTNATNEIFNAPENEAKLIWNAMLSVDVDRHQLRQLRILARDLKTLHGHANANTVEQHFVDHIFKRVIPGVYEWYNREGMDIGYEMPCETGEVEFKTPAVYIQDKRYDAKTQSFSQLDLVEECTMHLTGAYISIPLDKLFAVIY